ncbi:MAG: hypothetical protein RLZZ01_640 [Actinomycetota bacterium]
MTNPAATVTTVATPQSQVAYVTTVVGTTTVPTTVALEATSTTDVVSVSTSVSATAEPAPNPETTVTSTTLPGVVTPDAPEASLGGASAVVGGDEVAVAITREANALVLGVGEVTTVAYGETPAGDRIPLSAGGELRLETGDMVVVETSGFSSEGSVEVWMFSTPTLLGTIDGGDSGAGRFMVPPSIEPGDHRLVIAGSISGNVPVVLSLGLRVGLVDDALWSGIPIWIPVSFAVLLAVLVPTRYSRRRRDSSST